MTGESPKKIGRGYARLKAGQFQLMIDSWDPHLRAEKKSAKTIRTATRGAPTARRAREARLHAPTRETIRSRGQGYRSMTTLPCMCRPA
jgi:hypothetical protein